MWRSLAVVLVCVAGSCATPTPQRGQLPAADTPRIFELEELNWLEVDALDRARTLFIFPVGMLEQHGPHLPVGADTLAVEYEAHAVAREVSRASAAWNVVLLPTLAYGHSGANQLGDQPLHPGTYALRQSTLRAVLADIGSQLAENGFQWIFVLNGHGAPSHGIATDEACDFVSERYGVTMLDVSALFRADTVMQARGAELLRRFFSAAQIESFGMDVHAGLAETAGLLAVRPDLVAPGYRTLPSRAGSSLEELRAVATTPGWEGYLSSPAEATPEYGAAVERWWIDGLSELILQALRGEDMAARPSVPARLPPPIAPIIERALAREAAFAADLDAWLARRSR